MFIEDLSYFRGLECQVTTVENQVLTGILEIENGKILIQKKINTPIVILDPINVYSVQNLKS